MTTTGRPSGHPGGPRRDPHDDRLHRRLPRRHVPRHVVADAVPRQRRACSSATGGPCRSASSCRPCWAARRRRGTSRSRRSDRGGASALVDDLVALLQGVGDGLGVDAIVGDEDTARPRTALTNRRAHAFSQTIASAELSGSSRSPTCSKSSSLRMPWTSPSISTYGAATSSSRSLSSTPVTLPSASLVTKTRSMIDTVPELTRSAIAGATSPVNRFRERDDRDLDGTEHRRRRTWCLLVQLRLPTIGGGDGRRRRHRPVLGSSGRTPAGDGAYIGSGHDDWEDR